MKIADTYIRGNSRRLVYDAGDKVKVGPVDDLISLINKHDLLIVNDSATTPSSITAWNSQGQQLELRLLKNPGGDATFRAIAFQNGDWQIPTEIRQPADFQFPGSTLTIAGESATVTDIQGPVITLRFHGSKIPPIRRILEQGKVVQYSYMKEEVPLYAVQTVFASRPWSSEAPSAGLALNWKILFGILEKGSGIAAISHAAGLSSIGDHIKDRLLPLSEVSQVPLATLEKIKQARDLGGKVIAVGTSAARAVEAAWRRHKEARHTDEPFLNSMIISETEKILALDGIISGLHDEGESHFRLLSAFSPVSRIQKILETAANANCLTHEFGDFMFLLSR